MSNGMLTLNEVMKYLGLDKAGVEELIKRERLHAYKIGGTYLRFKKAQVVSLKERLHKRDNKKSPVVEKVRDFWYFNNFYIIMLFFLVVLLFIILR